MATETAGDAALPVVEVCLGTHDHVGCQECMTLTLRKEAIATNMSFKVGASRHVISEAGHMTMDNEPEMQFYTCACNMPDNSKLLVDGREHGTEIKRIRVVEDNIVTDFLKLDLNICCIVAVGSNIAAVSLYEKVAIISLDNGMTVQRYLTFDDHDCEGLVFHDDQLYVSDGMHTLFSYTTDGKRLGKIETNFEDEDAHLRLGELVLSDDGQIVYSCDYANVFAMDLSGQLLWKFQHDSYKTLSALTVDKNSSVYVSDFEENRVLQIRNSGRNVFVLNDGDCSLVQSPAAAYFCRDHFRLVVFAGGREPSSVNS